MPNLTKNYFYALEGLRGVAAIGVASFHWLLNFAGFLAVDFFLVLSGFILSHRYLYSNTTTTPTEFVVSRVARLYPMHLFGLLAYAMVFYAITHDIPRYQDGTLYTFIQQLTLTHNVGLNHYSQTWNIPSWSISVEFWINLLFFFLISRSSNSALLFFIAMGSLLVIINITGHLDTTYQNYFFFVNSGLLRGIASFLLGVLTYRAWAHLSKTKISNIVATLFEFLCLCLIVLLVFFRNGKMKELDFFVPFLFSVSTLIFALDKGIFSCFFRKAKHLGTISYSIYLNHLTALMIVDTTLKNFELTKMEMFPIYLALVLALSEVTYKLVEIPGKNLLLMTFTRITRQRT